MTAPVGEDNTRRLWLQFSGEEDDFGYWSEKFEAYMHVKDPRTKLTGDADANDAEKYSIWAELVQCIDTLSGMMLKSDCKGDGPAAWKVLKAHFSSTETPRVNESTRALYILNAKIRRRNDRLFNSRRGAKSSIRAGEGENLGNYASSYFTQRFTGVPTKYFKTVHDFSKDKTGLADVKKALKNFATSQGFKRDSGGATRSFLSQFPRGGGDDARTAVAEVDISLPVTQQTILVASTAHVI